MKKCLKCGCESNGMFCAECGTKLPDNPPEMRICPNCGVETDRKFCTECGTKVIEDSIENPEDFESAEECESAGDLNNPEAENDTKTFKTVENGEELEMNKKKRNENIIIGILCIVAVLGVMFWSNSNNDYTTGGTGVEESTDYDTDYGEDDYDSESSDYDGSEEDGATDEEIFEEAQNFDTSQCKSISYEELARNPDEYQAEQIKITGKVVQVMEGDEEVNQLRVAMNDNYDTIMYVEYDKRIMESRILEDDYITVYGMSFGTITYESTLGGNITIPSMLASKIVFN